MLRKNDKKESSYLSLKKETLYKCFLVKNSLAIGIHRNRLNFIGYHARAMIDPRITKLKGLFYSNYKVIKLKALLK